MKKVKLIVSFIIGILIILTPTIIVGRFYNTNLVMGSLLTSEFVMRNISLIIGLLIIYDGIKNFARK